MHRVGDVVQLGGTGPSVTVIKEVPNSVPPSVEVAWFDYGTQKYRRDTFPSDALQIYVAPTPVSIAGMLGGIQMGGGLQGGAGLGAAPPTGMPNVQGGGQKMKASSGGGYPNTFFTPKAAPQKSDQDCDGDSNCGKDCEDQKTANYIKYDVEEVIKLSPQTRTHYEYGARLNQNHPMEKIENYLYNIGHSTSGKDV